MTVLETLGRHVADLTPEALAPSTVEYAKALILDQIGCMTAARSLPQARMVVEGSRVLDGRPEAALIPCGPKTSLARAVYVNSYCGNLVDADDTYANDDWTVVGHLGSVVVPVGLACAEYSHRSGLELLTAVTVGYDVAIRIGLAIAPSPDEAVTAKGMGTWEIFGAAAAASRLLGLSALQCAHALAAAGVSAPVPALSAFYDRSGSVAWIKNNLGWAGLGGLMSAAPARAGMRGNLDLLEGGRFSRMCGSSRWSEDSIMTGLGRRFMGDDVSVKPYPACRCINSVLDAARKLADAWPGIDPARVERITVEVKSELAATTLSSYPSDITDIPFSIPYLVAAALARPGAMEGLGHVSREAIDSPDIKALCSRIRVSRVDRDQGAEAIRHVPETYARITVRAASGETAAAEQDVPFGTPVEGRRMSFRAVEDKFAALSEPLLGRARSAGIAERVRTLDRAPDMNEACAEMFAPP